MRAAYVPDAIIGDLDSIRPEVLRFYRAAGSRAHDLSHDQDTTDLHKAITTMVAEDAASALSELNEFEGRWLRQHRIFVAGALGGRLDHEVGWREGKGAVSGDAVFMHSNEATDHVK